MVRSLNGSFSANDEMSGSPLLAILIIATEVARNGHCLCPQECYEGGGGEAWLEGITDPLE